MLRGKHHNITWSCHLTIGIERSGREGSEVEVFTELWVLLGIDGASCSMRVGLERMDLTYRTCSCVHQFFYHRGHAPKPRMPHEQYIDATVNHSRHWCPGTPNQNPRLAVNVLVGTRDYMHDWFSASTIWLAKKGGPTWRVDHVFMWNLNSWDLQVRPGGLFRTTQARWG